MAPGAIAIAQSAAFVTGFVVTAVIAMRMLPVWPELREIGCAVLAAAVMALAVWPLRNSLPALPELLLQLVLGTAAYAAVILACDVGRWRSGLKLRWLARKARRR